MSETTTKADGETITAVDGGGRTLEIRRLAILEELDLVEMAGPRNSDNSRWMMTATLAMTVRSIDGRSLPAVTKMSWLRRRLVEVGPAGVRAVIKALAKDLPDDIEDEVEGTDEPMAIEKNSAGTPA